MADLADLNTDQLLEVARSGGDQPCPGCPQRVTFLIAANGRSMDILHPQPPCDGFRKFITDLQQAVPSAARGKRPLL